MVLITPHRRAALQQFARSSVPTLRYWMETEVHVYAFSIAANFLLSFFPFLIVMVSLCRYVLEWRAAEQAIYLALNEYFPEQLGGFVENNLKATVAARGPFQVMSLLLLFFTANGIFEPLEVALNRAWGIPKNRSYLRNQIVSLGLILACGALVLAAVVMGAANRSLIAALAGTQSSLTSLLTVLFFRLAGIPLLILVLLLVYWLLPNGRVPLRPLIPVSIAVGLALEAVKYTVLLIWPWLIAKLGHEYGPFKFSAAIILWSFVAAMLVLGGAEWSARNGLVNVQPPADSQQKKGPLLGERP
jgi:YihY family inner membrane protein